LYEFKSLNQTIMVADIFIVSLQSLIVFVCVSYHHSHFSMMI